MCRQANTNNQGVKDRIYLHPSNYLIECLTWDSLIPNIPFFFRALSLRGTSWYLKLCCFWVSVKNINGPVKHKQTFMLKHYFSFNNDW